MGKNHDPIDVQSLSAEQKRQLLERLLQEKAARSKSFPMSHGQAGLWHDFRRNPESTAFNVFLPTRIRSRLQPEILKAALQELARRHRSLRATFSDSDGKLTQKVHNSLAPQFVVVEMPGASDEKIRDALLRQAAVPFDLECGPLLRMHVYKVAEDDWVVFAQAHHIVVDFWSLILILGELREIYPQLIGGQNVTLPQAQNNYASFVKRQTEALLSQEGQRQREYWLRQANLGDHALELPTDYRRPATFSNRAAVAGLSFDSTTGTKLNALAQRLRITPVAIVHAAIGAVLAGYSGQEKFYIGSPFSGRSQKEFENTVGFFVNVLPLLADVSDNPSFGELSQRNAKSLLEALEHEDYPISSIVSESGVVRDASRSPLFQVSCTFEKAQLRSEAGRASFLFPGTESSVDFAGMRQVGFYFPHPTCHYDIEFVFELDGDTLRGMICYCADLFLAESIERIASVFQNLLEQGIEQPDWSVSKLLRSREQDTVRNKQLHQSSNADWKPLVHRAIQEQGRRFGQLAAIENSKESITYREFTDRAAKLTRQVIADGVEKGEYVAVCCSDGAAAFTAMLGLQFAGAVPVPIDSNQPAVSFTHLQTDTEIKHVVCDAPSDWSDPSLSHIFLNTDLYDCNGGHSEENCRVGEADNLAYVIYTSGSTGRPKGVLVQHKAIANTLAWRSKAVPLTPDDRVLMLLSHQFDAALGVAWTTFVQGATLVWPDKDVLRDPASLVEFITREGITVLPAVPSLLKVLIEQPGFSNCKSLRYIWTGGEGMPEGLPLKIRQTLGGVRFWNFYGPTEAAVEATAIDLTDHDVAKPIPIGHPIAGCEILILDKEHRELPQTMPGEIAIAGNGLARGYLNAKDLTSERFVQHPTVAGRRVYLTGDRGRILPNGAVEFLGRTDNQVKLRGYRLELGEVEMTAVQHAAVHTCAAKVIQPNGSPKTLVLFVEFKADDDHESGLKQLQSWLAEKLPAFKRPDFLVPMQSMPMLSSGKVDRKQLPNTIPATATKHNATPEGAAEEFIHACWADVIGASTVSVDSDFFAAGGTSLQAAMLTTRLSDEIGIRVPAALVFDLATIRTMTSRLYQLHEKVMSERFGPASAAPDSKSEKTSLLTPLQTSGTSHPIFLVHPPGGIVICYRDLATHFQGERPVYGIRSRGLHGQESMPASIEEMASEYVGAIRAIQPEGPYIIGGWSLGGLVAYEMGRQLKSSGREIECLVLLDTTVPEHSTTLVPEQERVHVGKEYGIELTLDQLGELPAEEQLPLLLEHAKMLGVLEEESPPEVVAQTLEDLQELFHRHVELATKYQLSPLDCKALLVRPSETPFELRVSEDRGWGHLISIVDVAFVPGHHHSMVQPPHVSEMATVLRKHLAGAKLVEADASGNPE